MQLEQSPLSPFPDHGPIVVAVSGGGDSMALLGLCLEQGGERAVHALIVDHGLRDGSDHEAKQTAQRCEAMGARAHVLTWKPGSQISAIQERARIARYGLMGQACREIGVSSLLVAHTQDDQAETLYMRREYGSGWRGLAGMATRQYAPIWPQLYDINLLRPLLGVSRAALRRYNERNSIEWLEDPSNQNMVFQRVRARAALSSDEALRLQLLSLGKDNRARRDGERDKASGLTARVETLAGGGFTLPISDIKNPGGHVLLARLILCASGRSQQVDMAAIERLVTRFVQPDFKSATLGGAVLTHRGTEGYLQVSRETGRWLAANNIISASAGVPIIFDGRYEITVNDKNLSIGPLWPVRGQLSKAQMKVLRGFPAQIRRSLFGVFRARKLVDAPELASGLTDHDNQGYRICCYRSLSEARLQRGFLGNES